MYLPTAFQETDPNRLHDFIEANSFGLLVSTLRGELFATHLPFLMDRSSGPSGCLVGHLARANPQWQELDGQDVLAVFSGSHAYISPTWYEATEVVPTWNYVAVHAYGTCRRIDDPGDLASVLVRMVATYERSLPQPWSIEPTTDFFQKMARMVVGLRIEINRLEGKWKLNQNQPRPRQEKVAAVLAGSADASAREIGRLMGERLKEMGELDRNPERETASGRHRFNHPGSISTSNP